MLVKAYEAPCLPLYSVVRCLLRLRMTMDEQGVRTDRPACLLDCKPPVNMSVVTIAKCLQQVQAQLPCAITCDFGNRFCH